MTVQFREYFAVAYTFSSTRGPLRGRCDLCRARNRSNEIIVGLHARGLRQGRANHVNRCLGMKELYKSHMEGRGVPEVPSLLEWPLIHTSNSSSLTNSARAEMKLKRSSGLLPISCSTILDVVARSVSRSWTRSNVRFWGDIVVSLS
jgi:hypothetical protein